MNEIQRRFRQGRQPAAPIHLRSQNKNINIRNTTTMAANGTTETTSLVHKSKEDEENFAKLKAYQP